MRDMRELTGAAGVLDEIDLVVSKVLEQRGYLLTREEAVEVWEKCSEQWSAGWLIVADHFKRNPNVFEPDQEYGRVLSGWVDEYNKRV